jgi:hypothetical protein
VVLGGYTENVQKPALNARTYVCSDFQNQYISWLNQNMVPRGFIIKSYSTLRYHLFNLGNRVMGQNHDAYEWPYISSELVIDNEPDYSLPENQRAMKEYVDKLLLLNTKLNAIGKTLYVYVPASKAEINRNSIPDKYKAVSVDNAVKSVDCFENIISKTNIPYLICRNMIDELQYTPFYTTGIHWSRTFEQQVTKRIVEDIRRITGENYRSFEIDTVTERRTPFWRDDDIFKVLNVWDIDNPIYYEYVETRENIIDYEKLSIVVQGDSFAEGIRYDLGMIYPNDISYYINRDNIVYGPNGYEKRIGDDWSTFDITGILDNVNVIIIEAAEPELKHYSYGFVDYMIAFLDKYEKSTAEPFAERFDAKTEGEWKNNSFFGMYGNRDGFSWTKRNTEIIIRNEEIAKNGLEIDFSIPEESFVIDETPVEVSVYINGLLCSIVKKEQGWNGSLIIDDIPATKRLTENLYYIEIITNRGFRPKEVGTNSEDNRELVLKMEYVGEKR